jgi:hypothetical protein
MLVAVTAAPWRSTNSSFPLWNHGCPGAAHPFDLQPEEVLELKYPFSLTTNGHPSDQQNDTVTEEIRVGDNDNLSALVANLIEADLLVLLTDQPGLFTADPRRNPDAQIITEVTEMEIPNSLWQAAGGTAGEQGTSGMITKLQAADLARRSERPS